MTDKQNSAPTEMAGWMEWADDTQNSAGGPVLGNGPIDPTEAVIALQRARITALEAHIAAEPDRMREVVERCAKVADQDADAYRSLGTVRFSARIIEASVDAAVRIAQVIRAQEIKP